MELRHNGNTCATDVHNQCTLSGRMQAFICTTRSSSNWLLSRTGGGAEYDEKSSTKRNKTEMAMTRDRKMKQ